MRPEWFDNCGARFLRPIIDLVAPKVVVALGKQAFDAIAAIYGLPRIKFKEAVERSDGFALADGISCFPVYHCGARILNPHRPMPKQLADWERVRRALVPPAPDRPWLDSDELEVVRAFQSAGVFFLLIGGRAVQFHGHARPAKDLDLFVEPSRENWAKLQTALRPLNSSVPSFAELSPDRKYKARLHFYETVEFLTAIEGISFAWSDSVETTFAGLQIRVMSKAHVIRSKEHSARRIDVEDILALKSLSI